MHEGGLDGPLGERGQRRVHPLDESEDLLLALQRVGRLDERAEARGPVRPEVPPGPRLGGAGRAALLQARGRRGAARRPADGRCGASEASRKVGWETCNCRAG